MSRRPVNRNIKRGAQTAHVSPWMAPAADERANTREVASGAACLAPLAATLHRAAVIAETERVSRGLRFGRLTVHPNYALAKACRNNPRAHDAALRYLHEALGAPRHLFIVPKRAAPLLFELGALVAGEQG